MSSLPRLFLHAVKQLDEEIPSPHTTPALPINSTNTDIQLKTNKYIYIYIHISLDELIHRKGGLIYLYVTHSNVT